MRYSKLFLLLSILFLLSMAGCQEDNGSEIIEPQIDTPDSYTFQRNNQSTVSFDGQTTRINMATELVSALENFSQSTQSSLLAMYRNTAEDGSDVDPFEDSALNESTKSIKSKVAASYDLFHSNTVLSNKLKQTFEQMISDQIDIVFENRNTLAAPGIAGQIADGTTVRYVNPQGLEMKQTINKGLIGALMMDQMVNNYLSPAVLNEGNNIFENENEVLAEDKNYTVMEHKWDEAFGYLFGGTEQYEDALETLGSDDIFLNKYLKRVDDDPDYTGIAQDIFDAFALGREAIVQNNLQIRDQQADLLKRYISEVIAIRAIYYLEDGANLLEANQHGSAFHSLSEGYGFVFSLQFAKNTQTDAPFYSSEEVDSYLEQLHSGNGLWEVEPTTLREIAKEIAERFSVDYEKAKN